MKLRSSLRLAYLVLIAAVVSPSLAQKAPVELTSSAGRLRVVTFVSGLVHPWSFVFLPDGHTMLIAEQTGKLRLVRDGVLQPQAVWNAPLNSSGEIFVLPDVLHGLDIHPQFAQNHLVYVSYLKNGPRGFTLAVARGKLEGAVLTEVSDIFVADAWESSASLGIAGRIMFGPDNTLYVAVGDRDLRYNTDDNAMRMRAQYLDGHMGRFFVSVMTVPF